MTVQCQKWVKNISLIVLYFSHVLGWCMCQIFLGSAVMTSLVILSQLEPNLGGTVHV